MFFSLSIGLIVFDLHQYKVGHPDKPCFYVRNGDEFLNISPRMAKHSFSAEKKDGVFRIFFVGDSSVIGWPYVKRQAVLFPGLSLNTKQAGIGCWLELQLRAAGIDTEIINAGMEWGVMNDEVKLVAEIIQKGSPDAIIFMSGHSEGSNLFPDRYCPLDKNLENEIAKISRGYEDGLKKIIDYTRKAHVRLILLTQPINLRHWMPEDFDGSVDCQKIEELILAERALEAREILLSEKDRKSPMRMNLIGRTFLATGDFWEARRYFLASNDLSRRFVSMRSMWNDIILKYRNIEDETNVLQRQQKLPNTGPLQVLAHDENRNIQDTSNVLHGQEKLEKYSSPQVLAHDGNHNIENPNDILGGQENGKQASLPQVLDFAGEFYRRSPDGLPGMDLFVDNCHFSLNGQRLGADIISDFLLRNVFGKYGTVSKPVSAELSAQVRRRIKTVFMIARINVVRYRILRFVLGLRLKRMPHSQTDNLRAIYENYTNRIREYTQSLEMDRLN